MQPKSILIAFAGLALGCASASDPICGIAGTIVVPVAVQDAVAAYPAVIEIDAGDRVRICTHGGQELSLEFSATSLGDACDPASVTATLHALTLGPNVVDCESLDWSTDEFTVDTAVIASATTDLPNGGASVGESATLTLSL